MKRIIEAGKGEVAFLKKAVGGVNPLHGSALKPATDKTRLFQATVGKIQF